MRTRFLLLAVAALIVGSPAYAEKRVALVVGNSAYQNVSPLANPKNDAELMATTLSRLGFALVGGGAQVDLDKTRFDQAVRSFGNQLIGADVALFYYAGHGLQIRGTNYLVPVTANPTREADADFQLLDVSLILRQMEGAGTKLNLVILDACRNNPFGGRGLRATEGGLAQLRAPEGTLLSYATQPGNVALDGDDGHSPYTKALVQTIQKPGLDVFQTFNQVGLLVKRATGSSQQPWVSSSPIDGSFYFANNSPSQPVVPVPAPAVPRQESRPVASGGINDCDRLAGNPADPQHKRGIAGVRLNQLDIIPALSACNAALSEAPDDARTNYQAGRVAYAQKDYAQARRLFEKAANAGYEASYLNLGVLYNFGYGVALDPAEARRWYEKALAASDPAAMNSLGLMSEQGVGGPKDPAEARRWYEKAVAAGSSAGMVSLARSLRDGLGGPKDFAQAKTWFEKAAAAGEPAGLSGLGTLYENGWGVARDYVEARKWFEKAIAARDVGALNALGYMYEQGWGMPKDLAEARRLYEKAAAAGQATSMSNLGNLFRDGRGAPQDYVQARTWYEKSAATGRTYAMIQLGDLYQKGLGVPKDRDQARKWYEKAAAAGDPAAKNSLSALDAAKK